jgi:hypothetical protein
MKTPRHTSLLAALFLVMTLDLAQGQGTIISVSGPPDTLHEWSELLYTGSSVAGVSWTAANAFSNVAISVSLGGDAGAMGMAYLTTSIGPETTAADEIASASFAWPSTSSLTPVLSGFNLGAGTYYLILIGTTTGINPYGLWNSTPSPSITSSPNVTDNGVYDYAGSIQGYPPSASLTRSSFINSLQFTVTGFPVLEPSSSLLTLLGSGVFIYVCTRNKKYSARSSQ